MKSPIQQLTIKNSIRLDFDKKSNITIYYDENMNLVMEITGHKIFHSTLSVLSRTYMTCLRHQILTQKSYILINDEKFDHEEYTETLNNPYLWKKFDSDTEGDKELKIIINNVKFINTKYLLPYEFEVIKKSDRVSTNDTQKSEII